MKNKILKAIFLEGKKAVEQNHGGPFGAAVVKDGKIIAKGHNQVLKTNDPTNHAEIVAIRKAAKKLKNFDLSGCELYTVCEPCPMCLGAIFWSGIKTVHFGCSAKDAGDIGFQDKDIYDFIKGKAGEKKLDLKQFDKEEFLKLFKSWDEKKDKTMY